MQKSSTPNITLKPFPAEHKGEPVFEIVHLNTSLVRILLNVFNRFHISVFETQVTFSRGNLELPAQNGTYTSKMYMNAVKCKCKKKKKKKSGLTVLAKHKLFLIVDT